MDIYKNYCTLKLVMDRVKIIYRQYIEILNNNEYLKSNPKVTFGFLHTKEEQEDYIFKRRQESIKYYKNRLLFLSKLRMIEDIINSDKEEHDLDKEIIMCRFIYNDMNHHKEFMNYSDELMDQLKENLRLLLLKKYYGLKDEDYINKRIPPYTIEYIIDNHKELEFLNLFKYLTIIGHYQGTNFFFL